jgi:hypothetical protein
MRTLAFALVLLLPSALLAQTAPAPKPAPAAPAKKPAFADALTGEHEAPLGLYIVPWRNSDAEGGAGRPARLMDEALTAHDADVFDRQVEYYRALSAHLEQTGRVTP